MRLPFTLLIGLALGPLLLHTAAAGSFGLPSVFSDGMVLQRERNVPVWGWDAPGTEVRVRAAGQEKSARAADDGSWTVLLDPLAAGTVGDITVQGTERRTIRDVLAGEVWFCSGQSNMDAYTYHLPAEVRGTKDYPQTRFFVIQREVASQPLRDVKARWTHCQPKEQCMCSAIGYLFARDLHERLDVPVGIIQSTWGDTRAEFWMPLESLQADPLLASYVRDWDQLSPKITTWADYEKRWQQWKETKQGEEPPPPQKIPASIFNAMVRPVIPYGIRGILWYQGESNAYQAKDYRTLFPGMIQGWRKAWGADVPFLFVQLPNYQKLDTTPPARSPWSELREAQTLALALPATEMAVTIDIGEEDIHPRNKPEVARRLMQVARATVYGEKVAYTGPRFSKASFEKDGVRVHFAHADGLATRDGGPVRGFALAGKDRKWHWAEATLEGSDVLVSCAQVPEPVAVRYAWAHNPPCNLANADGLPAAPFRTDTWE